MARTHAIGTLAAVFTTAAALLFAGSASAADRSVDVQTLGPSKSVAAAPPNDDVPEPLGMNEDTFEFNDQATVRTPELLTSTDPDAWGCTVDGDQAPSGWPMRNTIWYRVGGTGRTVSVYAVGGSIDSILAVYDENGEFVGCNDDVFEGELTWSALRFRTDAGRRYYLQVGSKCQNQVWGGDCGTARGTGLLFVGASTQPADDDRDDASMLTLGESRTESLVGATEEAEETLDCGDDAPFGKTRWFRVTVPAHGTLTVSATSAGHDSVVGIYPTGGSRLACNDDTEGTSSSARVTVAVRPGTYDVQLGGFLPGLLADDGEPTVLHASFVENPDPDGDGVAAGDCRPFNSAVYPGAAETVNNPVDENCDGHAAQDADHDGHVSTATGGADCNDGNGGIRPGAAEVPENNVDENCDGKDDRYPRVTSQPVIRWKFYRQSSEIEVVRVEVRDLAANTTATVVCSGRGCPKRKAQTRTVKRATAKLKFSIRFAKRLKRSAKVTLRITRPGHVGVVRQITVDRRRVNDRTLCLWPNERKPRRCGGSG